MEYITSKEAAEKWGISQQRFQVLCEQGRVEGAVRLGWVGMGSTSISRQASIFS